MSRFFNWLYNLLPCLHEKVVDYKSKAFGGHRAYCSKCLCRLSCDCQKCREPWRDW